MAKRCKHPMQTHWRDADDRLVKARCAACLQLLSLGPSNDDPEAVQIEIRAAELATADKVSIEEWPDNCTAGEGCGWIGHRTGDDPVTRDPYSPYWAGYLGRCIATHDLNLPRRLAGQR